MNKLELNQKIISILQKFPKSRKAKGPFLSLANGRKVYFNIFLKKYGIDGQIMEKYSKEDLYRRFVILDLIGFIFLNFPVKKEVSRNRKNCFISETAFFRIVLIEIYKQKKPRLEVLSIYKK